MLRADNGCSCKRVTLGAEGFARARSGRRVGPTRCVTPVCLRGVGMGTRAPMNRSPSGVPAGLPTTLADRPVDEEYGLPIPFVYAYEDGTHDFGAINRRRSIQCALS